MGFAMVIRVFGSILFYSEPLPTVSVEIETPSNGNKEM